VINQLFKGRIVRENLSLILGLNSYRSNLIYFTIELSINGIPFP